MSKNDKMLVVTVVNEMAEVVGTAIIEPLHLTTSQFDNQQVIDVAHGLLHDCMSQDDIEAFHNDSFSYLEEFTDDDSEPAITLLWRGYGVTLGQGDPIIRLHFQRVSITPAKN